MKKIKHIYLFIIALAITHFSFTLKVGGTIGGIVLTNKSVAQYLPSNNADGPATEITLN